jgi:hypothetical protein
MSHRLTFGAVRDTKRQAIYVLRVHDDILDFAEVDQLSAKMNDWLSHRGEPSADVVVVQGDRKETLRLFGTPIRSAWYGPQCSTPNSSGNQSAWNKASRTALYSRAAT